MSNVNPDTEKSGMTKAQWYSACWDYFSLLSEQRMKMLEYFITIELFLAGSLITLICLKERLQWAEIAVSGLILLMAIVFGFLDKRTRNMIHECEETMIAINDDAVVDGKYTGLNPISRVNNNRKEFLTYTKLIRFIQIVFALVGAACIFLVYKNII